jgi:hypothetical protein
MGAGAGTGRERNLEVVRAMWSAMRERRPRDIEPLLDEDVAWFPALLTAEPLRGRDAVRAQLERITSPTAVEDTQPLSFENVGATCVIVSAAVRLRRPGGGIATHHRWWVYRVHDGLIAHAANHDSRESAVAAARRLAAG